MLSQPLVTIFKKINNLVLIVKLNKMDVALHKRYWLGKIELYLENYSVTFRQTSKVTVISNFK